jgi:hypothetical protein
MLVLRPLLDLPVADLGFRKNRRTGKPGQQRRGDKNAFHVSPLNKRSRKLSIYPAPPQDLPRTSKTL